MLVRALRPVGMTALVALAALAAGTLSAPKAPRGHVAAMLAGPSTAHAQAGVCVAWGCQLNDPSFANVSLSPQGAFMTAGGMTLYSLSSDTQPRRTSCQVSGCGGRGAHPLFLLPQGGVQADAGIPGTFGSFSPYGNFLAVTYNDMPLYLCACDIQPGDANGDGVTDSWGTWSVARP